MIPVATVVSCLLIASSAFLEVAAAPVVAAPVVQPIIQNQNVMDEIKLKTAENTTPPNVDSFLGPIESLYKTNYEIPNFEKGGTIKKRKLGNNNKKDSNHRINKTTKLHRRPLKLKKKNKSESKKSKSKNKTQTNPRK